MSWTLSTWQQYFPLYVNLERRDNPDDRTRIGNLGNGTDTLTHKDDTDARISNTQCPNYRTRPENQ